MSLSRYSFACAFMVVGNLDRDRLHAERIGRILVESVGDVLDEIDEAGEILLGADRQVERVGVGLQLRADVVDAAEEIRRRRGPSC